MLKSHHSSEDSVILTKCNLAKAKSDAEGPPVVYINKGKTTIDKSPKKFQTPSPSLLANKRILLEQLALLRLHDRVDVPAATVLKVHQPITVGYDNKIMQKVLIADNTGNTTIQLWGDQINSFDTNKTYEFTNLVVKEFSKEKYLSFSPLSTAKEVSAIGDVMEPEESESNEAKEVEVIAVNCLTSAYRCIAKNCNSKVEKNAKNDRLGQCSKCGSLQKLSECSVNLTAQLIIKGPAFKETLYAYGNQLSIITGKPQDDIEREDLLIAEPFCITYTNSSITSVFRSV